MKDVSAFRNKFPKAISLCWDEIDSMVWQVFTDLKSSDFDPDIIIAIARGGLAPSRILMDYMQKKYVCSIQMGHWNSDSELAETPHLVYPLPDVDLHDKRVLLVDDVCDEGRTLKFARDYLAERALEVRTMVLVSKAESHVQPDFCPAVMDDWGWVLFPWSKHEDLLTFTEKALQLAGSATIEEIIRILQEAMDVEIATSDIEKVLVDMKDAGEIIEGTAREWKLV